MVAQKEDTTKRKDTLLGLKFCDRSISPKKRTSVRATAARIAGRSTRNQRYKSASPIKNSKKIINRSTKKVPTLAIAGPSSTSTTSLITNTRSKLFLNELKKFEPNEQLELWKTMISNHPFNCNQLMELKECIEGRITFDIISCLPYELALYVMSFLSAKELCQAALTCKSWQTVCEDSRLWRERCQEEDILNDEHTFELLFRKRLIKSYNRHLEITRLSLDYVPKQDWKLAYIKHIQILRNWKTRRFVISEPFTSNDPNNSNTNSPDYGNMRNESMNSSMNENQKDLLNEVNTRNGTTSFNNQSNINHMQQDFEESSSETVSHLMQLRCHEDMVITCLQFNPKTNTIVSGSDDHTLKVWSSETGRCINTLEGHTGGVWSSQLSPDDIVISGSTDRTLRVWFAYSGHLLHTLIGHTSTVRCLALQNNHVVSGSRDTTLRRWDIKTGKCLNVFTGHTSAIRCVEYKNDTIVSGAYDNKVMVWDVKSGLARFTLEYHINRIYSLQFDGKIIASGSLDSTICIWDAEQGKLLHHLTGHTSLTSKMQLKGNLLVSANADSYCRVWNVTTGECLHTLGDNGHKHTSAITSVHFNHRHVVTSSDDGTVKLWDIKTGQFLRDLVVLPTASKGGVVWRIRASYTKLICAIGSRIHGDTHLLVLNFED